MTTRRFVYFIRMGGSGPIKIGMASDPEARRNELQVSVPFQLAVLGVIKSSYWTESRLHRKFAANHIRGEWFQPDPSLIEFIRSRCVPGDYPMTPIIPMDAATPFPTPKPIDPESIDALDVPVRVKAALHKAGIHRIDEIGLGLASGRIHLLRGIGRLSIDQLRQLIDRSGDASAAV